MNVRYEIVDESRIRHLFSLGRREGLLFKDGTTYIAAIAGVSPVGYAGVKVKGANATLRNLYVIDDYRGRGIGRQLIREQKRLAKEMGATTAVAFTTDMSRALYLSENGTLIPHKRYTGKIEFQL